MTKIDYIFEKEGFIKKEIEEYLYYVNPITTYKVEINKNHQETTITKNGEYTNRLPRTILQLLCLKYKELGWLEDNQAN